MVTLMKRSLWLVFVIAYAMAYGQGNNQAPRKRGQIIYPANNTSPILDPNGDGFVSKTTAGFSNRDYNVGEFETPMFGIPKLGGDVTGDNIGNNCGITDLIPDSLKYSVYAVRTLYQGAEYLIFRFRVGDDNPSVESWTILLDTDNKIGAADNPTGLNPGFEIDITLIKRQNAGINVYNIDGIASCPSPILSYPYNGHFQISVADEVTCGDPDYFYDYYVPFAPIASAFNITSSTGLRYAAVTNVSATCAMAGKIADISGVDYTEYQDCIECAFIDLVENQCPTPVIDLAEGGPGFEKEKVSRPTINEPIRAGQSVVSGTTVESNIYVKLFIYQNIGTADSPDWGATPRETQQGSAIGTVWSFTLNQPLQAYDSIVAQTQLTASSVPCGGAGGNNTSSTSVTIVEPNDPPVANPQTLTTPEDTPLALVLTGSDPDGDAMTFSLVSGSGPTHGTLSASGTGWIYTPFANYFGPDTFSFTTSDGIYTSTPGIISITITPVNDAPVVTNRALTTPEDTALPITLAGTDAEGGSLTFTIVSGPTHGQITGTLPNIVYTPNLNYFGPDVFTYTANDGQLTSNVGTISINVSAVPDNPIAVDKVAVGQLVTTPEETPVAIQLFGYDPDGNAVTYTLVTLPAHGTITGTLPNITYTPASNYFGPDSFTFKVNDGTTDSNIATVSINVTPVDDIPVAFGQTVSTAEDTPVGINLVVSNPDADPLTYSYTQPVNGVVSGTGPALTYTPNANYFGTETFTYHVNDGVNNSNVATITVIVTRVDDDAPIATAQNISTPEETPVSITLSGIDPDGQAVTIVGYTNPTNGTLSGTAPNLIYTPNANYSGGDSFTFTVNDGTQNSAPGTITITVTPVNDAPQVANRNVTTPEDVPVGIVLTGTDPDPATVLSFSVVSNPSFGVLSGTAPNLTYTPNANYFGSDSFTYRASDGSLNSNIATVFITVTRVDNDAPVTNNLTTSTTEDTQVSFVLVASDPDGQPITYSITVPPANGTLLGTAPNLTYRPNLNYFGAETFKFRVSDGVNNSNEATVTINVTPVNDVPVANNANYTYVLNTTTAPFDLNGSDPDGDGLTYTILTDPNPLHGTLNGKPGPTGLSFTPATGFTGTASFTFRVNDGTVNSAVATITFSLQTGVNTPPDVVPGDATNIINVTTPEDTPLEIELVTSDIDGDVLTYFIQTLPTQGVLTLINPLGFPNSKILYTPNANYTGSDSFTFKANDGVDDSEIGTVNITITPVNDAPTATPQSISLAENTSVNVTLAGTDVETASGSLTYAVSTQPQFGTLSGTPPNVTYTPNLNYNGSDSFTFTASDGSLTSNPATVLITITAVNSNPVVVNPTNNQTLTTPEDTPIDIVVDALDPDGDVLTYELVSNGTNGGAVFNGSVITYTPNPNFVGSDQIEFLVRDPLGLESGVIVIIIDVTPINDAPIAATQGVVLAENIPSVDITVSGSDPDLDNITYELVTLPQHGTLKDKATGNEITGIGFIQQALVYVPDLNYNGADNFVFRVFDGLLYSDPASVLITITPVNSAPIVISPSSGQTVTTPEETPVAITVDAQDPDGDVLTYEVTTEPLNGTVIFDGSSFVYTPDADYVGSDSFEFIVSDGTLNSGVVVVNIEITPVNDAPIANSLSIVTTEDVAVTFIIAGTDPDGDDLTYELITQPLRGTLSGTAPNLVYTPNAEYSGQDSFSFRVLDESSASSSPAIVTITVTAINDTPVALPQSVSMLEDTTINIVLEATDADVSDVLTYSIVTSPQHGTLTGTAPNVTYAPSANYFGQDTFTFKANDGAIDSAPATVNIAIANTSDAPIAFDLTLSTPEDTPLDITVNASDPDLGDALSFILVSRVARGILSGNLPVVTYSPAPNFTGEESFTFIANNGLFDSNLATVTITVTPVNDSPVFDIINDKLMDEDSTLQICRNASDPEGDTFIYGDPVNLKGGGTLVPDPDFDFCYLYTPPLHYNGEVRWELSATDVNGAKGTTIVNILVTPVNDPPVAADDPVEVPSRTSATFNVLTNDLLIEASYKEFYDVFENNPAYADGLVLTTTPVEGPYHGTVSMQVNGDVRYTPNADYGGEDEVVYQVCDTYAYHATYCVTAKVLINIGPPALKAYEAVSPNGDGYNDYWRIDGIEFAPYNENKVQVFDRYNNLVWETQNYTNEDNNWTGQANRGLVTGILKEGTYYYIVSFNGQEPLSGFVVLKRE